MPNKRLLILFFLIVAAVTSGCARVSTFSVVHADGSYKRTVTYRVNEPAKSSSGDGSMTSGPGVAKFEDVAALPKGADWKVTRSMEDATSVIAATRDASDGTTISGDLGLKAGDSAGPAGKSAPLIANEVAVKRMPDGKIEYRELLHWNGQLNDELTKANPKFVAGIKSTLPPSVRGDTKAVDAMAISLQASLWDVLFGPPKALFADFLVNQDYATYQFGHRMQPAFEKALTKQFGSRLTAVDRATASEKMLQTLMQSASDKTKPDPQSSNANLAALFYRVQMPGKIVSANGEVSDYSNEVVWSLYSLGPAAKDITLTATSEAK